MEYLDLALLQSEFLPRVENLVTRVLLFEIDFQDVLKSTGEIMYKYFIPIINTIPPEKIESLRPKMEEILDNFVDREMIIEIEGVNILKMKNIDDEKSQIEVLAKLEILKEFCAFI